MTTERYSSMGDETVLGFLANALESRRGGDGDINASFPRSDAEDLSKGARFIPAEVTLARRDGKGVKFVTECGMNCWYWELSDGSRIYHYDPMTCYEIGIANGRQAVEDKYGHSQFEDGPGSCPQCGNVNTSGGLIQETE